MKKLRIFIMLVIVVAPLLGCVEDSREIDHRSMIVGLSIDQGEEEGSYAVTIQIPLLRSTTDEGASPMDKEFEVFTAEGETLWDAIGNLEANTPTVLFLGHLKVVTISEAVARESLKEVIDLLDRTPEIANQIYLLIIEEGSAEEFIALESPLVNLPALYLNRFFQADQKVGRTTDVKLFQFIRDMNMISRASVIPLAKIVEGDIRIENMAVFQDHRLVTKLLDDEVAMSRLMKRKEVGPMNYTIDIEHESEALKVALSRISLKVDIDFEKTDPIKYHLEIKGGGEVVELSTAEIRLSKELILKINEKMNEEIEEELRDVIAKMQEKNVEPWLMGHRIWANNYQFFDTLNWEETGWQQTEFEISVDFKVEMTGQRALLEKEKIGR
ncbi:hypothetical protein BKP35_06005 [Anaerobacillus arseniciselenatis]|uniref:Uncharacterized protein n=1 Tax=Anaerobacillus arseniciselenatis TaxID=85682 RepID=A0A1S2LQX5_9BACI|nr:Ger(x)C family spore germination protein [Anaerobacillus arseniciselenatis]OIJ14600.1 hypothetical protein BKP35_06005 [Anaerobacillus arseniciselenatis]